MQINLKKILAMICCAAMITSVFAIPVSSDEAEAAAEETTEEEAAPADPDAVIRTEEEVFALMEEDAVLQ